MTARRRGRWTYNSDSTYYGQAGWHLDGAELVTGTEIVVDFMPGLPAWCCHNPPHRGEYQLHNWPGREWDSVACTADDAMRIIEQEYDEAVLAALRGGS
jgi:hypothetical protein